MIFHIPSKSNIYQHMHKPAEENSGSNVRQLSFWVGLTWSSRDWWWWPGRPSRGRCYQWTLPWPFCGYSKQFCIQYHWENISTQTLSIVLGVPVESMTKELAISRYSMISSVDLSLHPGSEGRDNGKEERNFPGFQIYSGIRRSILLQKSLWWPSFQFSVKDICLLS